MKIKKKQHNQKGRNEKHGKGKTGKKNEKKGGIQKKDKRLMPKKRRNVVEETEKYVEIELGGEGEELDQEIMKHLPEEDEFEEIGEDAVVCTKDDDTTELNRHTKFINFDLDDAAISQLNLPKKSRVTNKHDLPGLGKLVEFCGNSQEELLFDTDASTSGWTSRIAGNYATLLEKLSGGEGVSESCHSLRAIIQSYADLIVVPPEDSFYRTTYVAQLLNHVVRTRSNVLRNNDRIHDMKGKVVEGEEPEEFLNSVRDEGFVRSSAMILVPFRKDAYTIVHLMQYLLFGDAGEGLVRRKNEFLEKFGDSGHRVGSSRMGGVKDDFKKLMDGNVDDCFRICVSITRKTMGLHAPDETADIIITSPLSLRMKLNGDQGTDAHLLSSMNVVVVDRCDVLLQQNWEHLLLIFKFLNKRPSTIMTHLGRIREVYLQDKGEYYCQKMFFGAYRHELVTALAVESSRNLRGIFMHSKPAAGLLNKINVPICQELHRIPMESVQTAADARFKFFTNKILHKLENHTVVFFPSYFDFVRVRNYLKRMVESFTQCHEYADEKQVQKARFLFFKGERKLLLITERFHFFKRYHIRGIHNVVFYQAPNDPNFYSDMINMGSQERGSCRMKCILPFSQFDRLRLHNIFGSNMANSILASDKPLQAIVSD